MEAAAHGEPACNVHGDPRNSFGTFTEAHGTVATVWLSGDCDAAAVPRLQATLQPLVHTRMRWVLLDMEEVTFLDSVALSVILDARAQLPSGGHFEVVQPSVPVKRLLHAVGFDALLGDADRHLVDPAGLDQRIDS
jgi:anti-sigma B factor antagonist